MVPKKSQFSPESQILPLWSVFEEGPKFQILYQSACLPNPRIARGRCVTILSTIYSQWSPRQFATHSPNIGIPPLSPRTVRPQQSISPPARVYFNLSTISSPIKRNTFHCYHLVRPSNLFHSVAVIMFLRNKESGCEKRNSCTVYVLLSQTVNCFMSQLFLVHQVCINCQTQII